MKKNLLRLCLTILLAGCAPKNFAEISSKVPTQNPDVPEQQTLVKLIEKSFKISDTQITLFQDQFVKNLTSLSFSIQKKDGLFVNAIDRLDLRLSEKSGVVANFSIESNSQKIVQPIDIVFVLDITGSMAPTIEAAKSRVKDFIFQIRDKKVHTRFCLVTFGDHTVEKCAQFTNNDPNDPSTLIEVERFVNKVSALTAPSGAGDYGGTDFDENQLRALIDASKAPWLPQSQRFAVLVTDASFHYSPNNKGGSGKDAPTYDEALSAISSAQMSVFAAAPKAAGYNSNFNNRPSLVEATNGIYFNYGDLVKGKITLSTILDKIIERIKTTYLVEYSVEDNFGWQSNLSLEERKISVAYLQPVGHDVVNLTRNSTWPNGHPEYKSSWKIDNKAILASSVVLLENGIKSNLRFQIVGNEIKFIDIPPPGSAIQVKYEFEKMIDKLAIAPLQFSKKAVLKNIKVKINGILANPENLIFGETHGENWMVSLTEEAVESPIYQIKESGQAIIEIFELKKKEK